MYESDSVISDKPSAWRGHRDYGYQLVKDFRPKTIVELGVYYGHSFYAFAQAVKDTGLTSVLYAIDTWKGDPNAGYYDESVYNDFTQAGEPYKDLDIRVLREGFDTAAKKIRRKIDFLHIDGSHDYESVRSDWETYSPKLAQRAVVLFHDTQVPQFGVARLFMELQEQHPEWNFGEREESYGLGIIKIGWGSDEESRVTSKS